MNDLLVIDFETAWSRDYTLSKMPTDSYVLDPRFKVFGAAVRLMSKHERAVWLPADFLAIFLEGVNWLTTGVVAHNTAFDGFILAHRYGKRPCFWFDTLSMARALIGVQVGASLSKVAKHYGLGEKGDEVMNTKGLTELSAEQMRRLGEYACNDADLCLAAFRKMRAEFTTPELQLIDLTLRMFIDPTVRLNASRLEQEIVDERVRKADFLQRAGATPEVLASNKQFAELLFMYGVEAPTKTSLTTGKTTLALAKTDPGFVELLEHPDEAIRTLAEARVAIKSTLKETRAERFLEVARADRPWPVLLNYYGAGTTGRWSGGNKQNPQNLNRGGALRESIEAPPGHKLVVVDSSQIEARTLAWVAGQYDLLEVFRSKGDPYCRMASALYKREITKADKDERQVGKTMVLGCGYGMGGEKFRGTVKRNTGISLTESEANLAVFTYRVANPMIPKLWRRMDEDLRLIAAGQSKSYGCYAIGPQGIHLPNGLWIKYPDLRCGADGFTYATKRGRTSIYGGKATENLIQALARIIVAEQMLTLDKFLRRFGGRIWLMAHDEICMVVPERHAEPTKKAALLVMSTPPAWAPDLPVAAEAGIGDTYGAAK